jgi:hypothetical protein
VEVICHLLIISQLLEILELIIYHDTGVNDQPISPLTNQASNYSPTQEQRGIYAMIVLDIAKSQYDFRPGQLLSKD